MVWSPFLLSAILELVRKEAGTGVNRGPGLIGSTARMELAKPLGRSRRTGRAMADDIPVDNDYELSREEENSEVDGSTVG